MSRRNARSSSLSRRTFLGSTAGVLAAASFGRSDEPREPSLFVYPDRLSYEPGDVVKLQTSTNSATYDLKIERVGAKRETVWSRAGVKGADHATPADASSAGCHWPTALEVPVSADWSTGYYEITSSPSPVFIDFNGKPASFQPYFVVRSSSPGKNAKILLQLATNTDNAYGNFGGYSLYAYNGRDGVQGRRVSFERPLSGFNTRRWELPFIKWCEANGYGLDYAVNNDLADRPELLDAYRLILSVGHDEYWSAAMRDRVEAYVARGGNLAFFSGNVCCWQVRHDANGLTCYKEYFRDDPLYQPAGPNPTLSTLWSHHLIDRPENRLTGVGVLGGGFHLSHGQYMDGSGAFTVERPEHWVLAGTNLARNTSFGGKQTVVGYECDGCEFERRDGLPFPTGRDGTPSDFEILATAPAMWGPEAGLLFYDRWPKNQHGAACLGLYRNQGGGTVFTAGTTDWSHGLRDPLDPAVDRITRNVLDRLSAPT